MGYGKSPFIKALEAAYPRTAKPRSILGDSDDLTSDLLIAADLRMEAKRSEFEKRMNRPLEDSDKDTVKVKQEL